MGNITRKLKKETYYKLFLFILHIKKLEKKLFQIMLFFFNFIDTFFDGFCYH